MRKKGINIKEIEIYNKWKINPKIENKLDFLWWNLRILDKVSAKKTLAILEEIDNLLKNSNDENLLYWFLRFIKDNNLFNLSYEVKTKIKELIKEYMLKIEDLYNCEKIILEKYMIKEPLEIINKYW